MVWLISFPRSGNTFLRNVLHACYGLPSSTYHNESYPLDPNWDEYPLVKSHLFFDSLPSTQRNWPIVYLLRDGRDACVSLAHHRSDVVAPSSDFHNNLEAVIKAAEGSHFGGWSAHVRHWLPRANLVIRFEELIADPIGVCERLRSITDLPEPDIHALPTFSELRSGKAQYGTGVRFLSESEQSRLAQNWFRKGEVNGWMDEMDEHQQRLFWHMHGEQMERVGYTLSGEKAEPNLFFGDPFLREDAKRRRATHPLKVLVEANKLRDYHSDGIKRYVSELVRVLAEVEHQDFIIQAHIDGGILSLAEAQQVVSAPSSESKDWLEKFRDGLKFVLPAVFYRALAQKLPLHRLRAVLRSLYKSGSTAVTAIHTDVYHLTLPQHWEEGSKVVASTFIGTVHDFSHLLFPHFHEASNVSKATAGMQWLESSARGILAVSESTAAAVKREVSLPVHCSNLGVDRSVFSRVDNVHLLALVREKYSLPASCFFLSVNTHEPRKNLQALVDAFAKFSLQNEHSFQLVLAGRKGWKTNTLDIPENIREKVHFTGYVSEEHLPALYTLAHGFCYPSLYEGFGLPLLEAMACGCPVLTSDESSMPEVVGQAGVLVDPRSLESIANGLEMLAEESDWQQRSILVQKRSWEFTWTRCATATLKAYLALADDRAIPERNQD